MKELREGLSIVRRADQRVPDPSEVRLGALERMPRVVKVEQKDPRLNDYKAVGAGRRSADRYA